MVQPHRSFYARYLELASRAQMLPHYRDPTFLEKYARRYQEQLLKARQTIISEHAAFEQDALFVAYLKQVAPDLIEWHAWRMKVLALAEQLDSGHKRHRLTPEEKREQILAWERVQALDHMALILERHRFKAQFRNALRAELDVNDIDELDRIEREFEAELDTDPNEGPHRKL